MFNKDFYPTPEGVIAHMLDGINLKGKKVLEPSAGKGNIVDYLKRSGADVIACELNPDLRSIVQQKCTVIAADFLSVTKEQVSHMDLIVMNPPFSADERHILHAYEIAPDGCKVIALCNMDTLKNDYTRERRQLLSIIKNNGHFEDIGSPFEEGERATQVNVGLINLQKPGGTYDAEFDGFFMDDDPQENGSTAGLMPYNVVRDLVNRYITAIKLYDRQLELAQEMARITAGTFRGEIGMQVTADQAPLSRQQFKKAIQKSAWMHIFEKMNMEKHTTKGLREDINKFVEKQTHIPFTMRNVYHMLTIVIGTTSQRMDRAVLEVFDKLTQHYDENRYNVEGWKTNSHYLMNQRFILPYICEPNYRSSINVRYYNGNAELINDMSKAICYLEGVSYETIGDLRANDLQANTWYEWGFFRYKVFKKGTGHFEFKDADVWARFNQHIARIKGYPLFEQPKAKRPAAASI